LKQWSKTLITTSEQFTTAIYALSRLRLK